MKRTLAGEKVAAEWLHRSEAGALIPCEITTARLETGDRFIGLGDVYFEQADGTLPRPYEGLGLGLAYSKRIIELMGGKIWVDSEPGQGSKFTFTCKFKILQTETTARSTD